MLQPEKNKHDKQFTPQDIGRGTYYCRKCEKDLNEFKDSEACIPDSIDIKDWNVAMYWWDWAAGEFLEADLEDAMMDVYQNSEYNNLMSYKMWLLVKAQPKHYLIAAATLKQENK